jgi:hypothetical protein
VDSFDVLIFVHILGVVLIAAGAGIGMASSMAMSRSTSVRTIGTLSALGFRAEHFVVLPGAVLTLVTGTWLIVDDTGAPFQLFDVDETWLWLSYVVWVVAIGLGEGVLAPFHHRLHRRARALEAEGVETSDDLQHAAASPFAAATGGLLTLLLLLLLYLMVFQPGR